MNKPTFIVICLVALAVGIACAELRFMWKHKKQGVECEAISMSSIVKIRATNELLARQAALESCASSTQGYDECVITYCR